jgi:hypothetical protein
MKRDFTGRVRVRQDETVHVELAFVCFFLCGGALLDTIQPPPKGSRLSGPCHKARFAFLHNECLSFTTQTIKTSR